MKRRGFTLVEVLVSLAIFGLAAVALASAYTNVLLARQAMRRLDIEDDGFTRSRAALLETIGLEDAKEGGEIDLPNEQKATWRCDIEPTAVSDLFSVTLEVESASSTNTENDIKRAETFYLLRPSWSLSSDRSKLLAAARERLRKGRPFEGTSTADQQGGGSSTSGGSRGGKGGGKGDNGGGKGGNGGGGGQGGGNTGGQGGGRGDSQGGGQGGGGQPRPGANNNGGGQSGGGAPRPQ
jgi:general secretion pathway protein I